MKYKITFTTKYTENGGSSSGTGEMTAENFDEMAEEIKRWMGGKNATAVIDKVEEHDY